MTKLLGYAKRNTIGTGTAKSKLLYAAKTLFGATQPNSISTVLVPAVPAITAKTTLTAAQNTAGIAANVRFPGSPAYPANTAVPAVTAVALIPAKTTPVIKPDPVWQNSVSIDESNADYIKIVAHLPYSPAAIAKGYSVDTSQILPMGNFDLGDWLGAPLGIVQSEDTAEYMVNGILGTVEQFFYDAAMSIDPVPGTTNIVEARTWKPLNPALPAAPCVYCELYIPKGGY
jgi:hypothetical protein